MIKFIICLCIALFLVRFSHAQDFKKIDSLQQQANKQKNDSALVWLYIRISDEYWSD